MRPVARPPDPGSERRSAGRNAAGRDPRRLRARRSQRGARALRPQPGALRGVLRRGANEWSNEIISKL